MIIHPQFDPVIFSFGSLSFRWYGFMYVLGFLGGRVIMRRQLKYEHIKTQGWEKCDIDNLLFYSILGVVLGGRFGYVFLYKFDYYLDSPLKIFAIWEGGMSFHGGALGVALSIFFYYLKHKRTLSFLKVTEFIIPSVPFGIATGRLGNFINGELWGRVTREDAIWAMGFPQAIYDDLAWIRKSANFMSEIDVSNISHLYPIMLPRHPSQLYEMLLEGILLLFLLLCLARRAKPIGFLTGIFLVWYGFVRFVIEFTREPDSHLGLLTFGLSMGQWLSLPMIFIGGILLFLRTNPRDSNQC